MVSTEIQAVAWMSAKRRRYVEGAVRDIPSPDFTNLESALDLLLEFFQEMEQLESLDAKRERVLERLSLHPTLLVVDDIDSISDAPEDIDPDTGDVYEFFTDDVMHTKSRVLFTSRTRLLAWLAAKPMCLGLPATRRADTSM
jgi:hypothetical protein